MRISSCSFLHYKRKGLKTVQIYECNSQALKIVLFFNLLLSFLIIEIQRKNFILIKYYKQHLETTEQRCLRL